MGVFQKISGRNVSRAVRSFGFFILFYLYLWLDVEPRLIYHGGEMVENFPVFYKGWGFLQKFISYPGGAVEYLSALLSQFFYYSWAGALVVTLQAWLIYLCTGRFIKAIHAPQLYWARFVPPILLLIVYTKYTYHFVTTMALLVALAFVCLYLRVTLKSQMLRLIIFLVLSVILYYVAAGAYMLFAVLCGTYESFFTRRWQIGLLYFLSAPAIPYIEGVLVFGVSIINAFSDLLPFSWEIPFYETRRETLIIIYILYLFLPLASIEAGIWQLFAGAPNQAASDEPNSSEINKKFKEKRRGKLSEILSLYFRNNKLRWVIESLVLLLSAGAAVFFSYDKKLKALFEVDYYSCHRMWAEVLAAGYRYPNNYAVIPTVNRALYHTGRLGSEMFSYSQYPDALLLTTKDIFAKWGRFDTYIELGCINLAENALIESMEVFGERPTILKRLALINMVKGRMGAVRVYLGVLSKTLFDADWANNYLSRLKSDPNLSTDEEIQHLRSIAMEENYVLVWPANEEMFSDLLKKNGQNQMAFEYLMAWYLLNGRIEEFVLNLDRLDDFDYSGIPRHYEEAILIYESLTSRQVDLKGRKLDPALREQLKMFEEIYEYYRANNQTAVNELAKYYGDSYFFYFTYGGSGMKR